MKPPPSAEIFESSTSHYWFDGELLFVVSKKDPVTTGVNREQEIENFKQKIGGKKVCAVMDVSNSKPSSAEDRQRNSEEFPKIFKAIAFIIKNPVTRMIAHVYLGVKPLSFPVKMTSNEEEAITWVKQYI